MFKGKFILVVFVSVFSMNFGIANNDLNKFMDRYLVAKASQNEGVTSDAEAQRFPYTIQVASYVNEKDAATHVSELSVQEKEAFFYPAFVRGQIWFKVCVGKFQNYEDAEKYRKTFIQRMEEPFSVVISLLDRPSARQVAHKKAAPKKVVADEPARSLASVGTKAVATAPVKEQGKMVPPVQAIAEHLYSLQIGAFPTEKGAQDRLTSIGASTKGTETFVETADVNGRTWYRAYVGKFLTQEEAKAFQQSLSEKNQGVDSFVRKVK